MKFIVNNALSNRVDMLFKQAIISREVLAKNKILYEVDMSQNKTLFESFIRQFHIRTF